jgi:hypothetical protein
MANLWLDFYISRRSNASEYGRFEELCRNFYNTLELQDFKFIDLEDFLRFVPEDCSNERGMAGVLWKRYIAPKHANKDAGRGGREVRG